MKKHLSRWRFEVLALAIGLSLAALHWWSDNEPVQRQQHAEGISESVLRTIQILEGKATDAQFRLRGPLPPHPDVVVLAVDEKSVQKYGRWPWPRNVIADTLLKLHEAEVASVGM